MKLSHFTVVFILLSLISLASPSKAAMLEKTTIDGVQIEVRRPDNDVYPLIIFSHGMGACPADYSSIQDRLSDAGYLVISPKHNDCISGSKKPDVPWRDAEKWTKDTNGNRKNDIHSVLDALPSSQYAKYVKSFKQVGCAGHSMGGYTCMGLAGAWDTWKTNKITSIAVLSPWHKPYVVQDKIMKMTNVKTLYQGGTKDRPISTDLVRVNGAFEQTSSSKYLQIFKRARHSSWTDGFLAKRFHEQMSYYMVSFFNATLKEGSKEHLAVKKSQVETLYFKH